MKYITNYQLDINRGFQCKVNGKRFDIYFHMSSDEKHWFLTHPLEKLLIELELDPNSVIKSYGTLGENHLVYCDSKQKCYDLCQHIVDRYFKTTELVKDIISFKCGNESRKFELTLLAGKFIWKNMHNDSEHIINKNQIDIQKIKKELSIKIYAIADSDCLGFDSREDALKFIKWVKENFYDKQEVCEKSREQLKHYYHGTEQVNFPNSTFILKQFRAREYFWSGTNPNIGSKDIYKQFELSVDQVLEICDNLKLHAYFCTNTLLFGSREDAIKFTDYLIETYIIKKEKTYDTNRLRKERTSLSRGVKPAGSIIHGRRSKASVRCRHLEHKARIGC